MIQFTQKEISHLREKGKRHPDIIMRMREEVKEVFEDPIVVPTRGIANWYHYYYCPKCSVQLVFDRHSRFYHLCPACRQILTGEPYDSTWWGRINMSNYSTVHKMSLLYLVTEEMSYAKKSIDIMLEYSKYYKDYEVHGGIPYNGPGKAGIQTLDEANFLRGFALSYDLLSDVMTLEEKEKIRDGMLIPGAEFLMEHRHNQLHNHEVIINSAIAIIGLIFDNEHYIQTALYEPYGIIYQLEHGMLENHMWFEGGFGYHFYALESFMAYEKFALHTSHSNIKHPNYKAMMELLASYLEPDSQMPLLNDTNFTHKNSDMSIYEFTYREIGGDKLLYILNEVYKNRRRDNMEAFFYGVDELPMCNIEFCNYHIDEGKSGSTVLRGIDDRYLLFKHDKYGGEHDHYDRLGISYLAYGKRISPDLGTTGYGALLHYDYYKNTGSHNTVTIGEENQAPVNAILKRYEERDGVIYVTAEADWTAPYQMPDTFTIVQWKEENYRHVKMKRMIAWTDDYFAEVFIVTGAELTLPIDWLMHFSGETIQEPEGRLMELFSDKKPFKHLHNMKKTDATTIKDSVITAYRDGDVITHVFGRNFGQSIYCGQGPDNPSISEIQYRLERCYGQEAIFAHVITSSRGECKVKNVMFDCNDITAKMKIQVEKADGSTQIIHFEK